MFFLFLQIFNLLRSVIIPYQKIHFQLLTIQGKCETRKQRQILKKNFLNADIAGIKHTKKSRAKTTWLFTSIKVKNVYSRKNHFLASCASALICCW